MRQYWVKAFSPITEGGIRDFARAIGDGNPIHQDNEAAKATGLCGIIAPGVMIVGFASSTIADEIPGSEIGKLEMKFRNHLYAGSVPVVSCQVLHHSEGLGAARIRVSITNFAERVADGTCLITLPKRERPQKAA